MIKEWLQAPKSENESQYNTRPRNQLNAETGKVAKVRQKTEGDRRRQKKMTGQSRGTTGGAGSKKYFSFMGLQKNPIDRKARVKFTIKGRQLKLISSFS
ncbi:MAG: hypothetical protein Q3M24_15010 [Candidatus Electrothrix aestuarii]|uniref:Uncharacterized protein n=1 Tax=Candidatus Electrothrix aestuarii TaxID=3062594 RepID=A0AAU8LQV9_9BACT|nr:hypothetical protein [Candidatus Electrothrix aestuarii]